MFARFPLDIIQRCPFSSDGYDIPWRISPTPLFCRLVWRLLKVSHYDRYTKHTVHNTLDMGQILIKQSLCLRKMPKYHTNEFASLDTNSSLWIAPFEQYEPNATAQMRRSRLTPNCSSNTKTQIGWLTTTAWLVYNIQLLHTYINEEAQKMTYY